MKRQPTEWEKIFANKGPTRDYSPKYINSSWSSGYESKQPNQKMGRRYKQKFIQRGHKDSQKAHENMPITREMYIKASMR